VTARDPLARVRRRPDPADWADDDKLTLREAVALFWPEGPVTLATIRGVIAKGELTPFWLGNRFFVTPAQMRGLFQPRPCRDRPRGPGSTSEKVAAIPGPAGPSPTSTTSETERLNAALASVQIGLAKLRRHSPPTSSKSRLGPRTGPQAAIPTAPVIPMRSSSRRS